MPAISLSWFFLIDVVVISSRRAPTPSEVADDNESVVESTTGTSRRTRTEEQRIQYLLEQPDCGELEPHRAFCKRCDKWVSMGKRDRYPVYMWTRHVKNCKTRKPTYAPLLSTDSSQHQPLSFLVHPMAPRVVTTRRRRLVLWNVALDRAKIGSRISWTATLVH